MKFHRCIRRIPEAATVCLAWAIVPLLPRCAVLLLSRLLGALAYACAAPLRRVALANLDLAYGERLSRQEKRALARRSFQTFALLALDLFWFSLRAERRLARHVALPPEVRRVLDMTPSVVVCGHLGNWEVGGRAIAWQGYALTSLVAPIKSPAADFLVNRMRRSTGQELVSKKGAVRGLLRALREGGRACLLIDQNTVPAKGGVYVDLFGVPVPISRAPAMLCLRTGAFVFFGCCVADRKGNYRFEAGEPLSPGDVPGGEQELTQYFAGCLEKAILRYPDQWLWMYKRWKFIPAGADPACYPFYARPLSPREAG